MEYQAIITSLDFWLGACLLTLTALVFKKAKHAILNMAKSKIEDINKPILDSEEANKEANNLIVQAQEALTNSEEIRKNNARSIEKSRKHSLDAISSKYANKKNNDKENIFTDLAYDFDKALNSNYKNILHISSHAVASALKANLDDSSKKKMAQDAIEKLQKIANNQEAN